MPTLVPIFADQLSHTLSALHSADRNDAVVLMMEVRGEANHVWHHRRKLVFLFSAMRHFARELREDGWQVRYVELTDPGNSGDFTGEVLRASRELGAGKVLATEPGEWRVLDMMRAWRDEHGLDVRLLRDSRFLASHEEFCAWAEGRKELRVEYFYRGMRRATGLLMDGDKPAGGQWNFDKENREPPGMNLKPPARFRVQPDEITQAVLDMVEREYPDRFGSVEDFHYAVTAGDAKRALDHFITHCLPDFGTWQDAMVSGEPFLHHSLLSFYLNTGLLDPLEACRAAETSYEEDRAPLNAAEGFIRQIIGWREYVRGIYWLKMPGYEASNELAADAGLPGFYWTAETRMNCMREVISQTREHAYSHHIQRLMITGNFALLAGIDPRQVHEWYLAVYADAFEWVEMPNTLGMALYADGGLLASKPYAASANYISRMSNFCEGCAYDKAQRTGGNACPFNALYWDFLARNRERFATNRRMAMILRNLERMEPDELGDIRKRAGEVRKAMAAGTL